MRQKTYSAYSIMVAIALSFVFSTTSFASSNANWVRMSPLLYPRLKFRTLVVDEKVYALSGQGATRVFEVYDLATDKWTTKANVPTPRQTYGACVADGIIYVMGGIPSFGGSNSAVGHVMEAYDPGTDTWTRKADMPAARRRLDVCSVDGIVYAIGGQYEGTSLRTVEAYDPATDTWTRKADMLEPRAYHAVGVIDGKIYAAAGGGISRIYIEMYDPSTDVWTAVVPVGGRTNANWSPTGTVVNGKMYIMGGYGGGNQTKIVVFDPSSSTVEILDMRMPYPLAFAADFAYNNKIYLVGGWTSGGKTYDDVTVYDPLAAPPAPQAQSGRIQVRSLDAIGKLTVKWGLLKVVE